MPEQASGLPSPTARDVMAVFFRQRRPLLISFGLIFALLLSYGLFHPVYEAHMKLLLRRGRMDPVISPQASPSLDGHEGISEEELNSEAELIRDEDLLREIAESSGVANQSPWHRRLMGEGPEQTLARTVRGLARSLSVQPIRKANLIEVKYQAGDPQTGARVLKTLARLYIEKHARIHRPNEESGFFDQQALLSGERLRDAELQLMNFTRDRGVVSAALERDIALQKLSEADANFRQVCLQSAETGQRIAALEATLPSLPSRTTTQIRTSDNPLLLEKLKSRLLELRLKRTELLTKYEPSYRLVQEVDQQIAEASDAIASEMKEPVREEITEQDPNHEWARSELEKARVELSGLQIRADAAATQLQESRSKARQLALDAITQQDLLRSMKTAEESYLLYLRKREESRIGDALDDQKILNVTLAEAPVAPALPKWSITTVTLLSAGIASLCSTTMAFLWDYLDPAFRRPEEVVAELGIPVLASIPRQAA